VLRSLALLGVNDRQVEAVSFGEERPAAAGADEAAWAKNRRAELKDR
jgi:peptidoglycan-associated lipoprotein